MIRCRCILFTLVTLTFANVDVNKIFFRHKRPSVDWGIEMFQIDNYQESFKLQTPQLSVFLRANHYYYNEIWELKMQVLIKHYL